MDDGRSHHSVETLQLYTLVDPTPNAMFFLVLFLFLLLILYISTGDEGGITKEDTHVPRRNLFLGHHSLVEVELGSLEDDAVAATGLTRSAGDLGEETARAELVVEGRLEGAVLLPGGELALDVVGLLAGILDLGGLALLETNLEAVVGLVPLLEGVGIDEDDGTLDEGLGTDELVVGGVVGNVEDTDLAGADLGAPGEVAGVETEGTELEVAAAAADGVDATLADLGHGGGAAHFELPLLAVLLTAAAGFAALVPSLTCDTLKIDWQKMCRNAVIIMVRRKVGCEYGDINRGVTCSSKTAFPFRPNFGPDQQQQQNPRWKPRDPPAARKSHEAERFSDEAPAPATSTEIAQCCD